MLGNSLLLALLVTAPPSNISAEARQPIALTPITFTDTSGEVRDQTVLHQRRLADFVARLKQELGTSGKFDMADFACVDDQCRPEDTLAKARSEGRRYVLFGAVQKSSSLVLWARVDVVDANTAKPVIVRWITFRGDTDEAWQRTARFVGRAINNGFPSQ